MKPLMASLAVIVFLFSPPVLPMAFAALGGDAASIDADRAQMKGSEELKQASTYTVHQLKGASGTLVREYISSGGVYSRSRGKDNLFPTCSNCSAVISISIPRR